MKRYYYTIMLLLILGFVTNRSYSQNKTAIDTALIKRLSTELNLNIKQSFKLYQTMRANKGRIDSLVNNKNIKPLEKQKALLALLIDRDNKVKALLSAEQQTKFVNLMRTDMAEDRQRKYNQMDSLKISQRRDQKKRAILNNLKPKIKKDETQQ